MEDEIMEAIVQTRYGSTEVLQLAEVETLGMDVSGTVEAVMP
jgi:hypothetical protein